MDQNIARYIVFMEWLPLNLTPCGKLSKPSLVQRLVRTIRWLQFVAHGFAFYAFLIPHKLGLAPLSIEEFESVRSRDSKSMARCVEILSSAYSLDARPIRLSAPQSCPVCASDSDIFVHPRAVCAACWLPQQLVVRRVYLFKPNPTREWRYLFSLLLKNYSFYL